LLRTAHVRVYSRGRPGEDRVLACLLRSGRSTTLGAGSFDGGPDGFVAAGAHVAFVERLTSRSTGDTHL